MGRHKFLKSADKINLMNNKLIEEVGINGLIKKYKEGIKINKISIINNAFNNFKGNVHMYPKVSSLDNNTKSVIKQLEVNITKAPIIFKIEDNYDEDINNFIPRQIIIPFSNFFIASNIAIEFENEIYLSEGFYILDFDEEWLQMSYFWSKAIGEGWGMNTMLIKKLTINNKEKGVDSVSYKELATNPSRELNKILVTRFYYLINKILKLLEQMEYNKYYVYEGGNIIEKEIIFSHKVSAHKRHFWEDSGRFNIPFIPKEEIIKLGYFIDGLVYRGGELRKDVPYTIIGEFCIGNEKKECRSREVELFKKRIFRAEEKLGKILKFLFPNEYIKRHDRKRLGGLELDYIIPRLRLAIEYDGEQHFDKELYEKIYGDGFDNQVRRDRLKDKLCRRKGIKLIRIKYDESITKSLLKSKL